MEDVRTRSPVAETLDSATHETEAVEIITASAVTVVSPAASNEPLNTRTALKAALDCPTAEKLASLYRLALAVNAETATAANEP
jgi:hypothetical protein